MDIENHLKALLLLLLRLVWIAVRVGIVLVTKAVYQASVTNRAQEKAHQGD
ncbi:hypothetical protein [Vibrio vulnificus YJ016]|uniref:Uncharacterized protein n=1 Tax=Vibrio vulnificus (strain YJ016) TaxID=196600 RepID=Q7ME28_VIBVY|nr:hypothetical protein [Vibrio vulnificus YJ016]